MGTTRILNGATEKIVALFLDSAGDGITGDTPTLAIWRESDDNWYTGAAWQAGYSVVAGGLDNEQGQGWYYYSFNTSGFNDDDTYHIKGKCGDSSCVNPVVMGTLKAGFYVQDILDDTNALINHLLDIKGTGFAKDTHSLPQCLTAAGFSTHSAADVVAQVIEGTITLKQAFMIALASAAGKATGGGTTTIIFKSQDGAKNRITLTVDSSGNRSAVVLDVT